MSADLRPGSSAKADQEKVRAFTHRAASMQIAMTKASAFMRHNISPITASSSRQVAGRRFFAHLSSGNHRRRMSCRVPFRALTPRLLGRRRPKEGAPSESGRGEIGRHARFRFWWRKLWGFKSLRPHQPAHRLQALAPKFEDSRPDAGYRDALRRAKARLFRCRASRGHRRACEGEARRYRQDDPPSRLSAQARCRST